MLRISERHAPPRRTLAVVAAVVLMLPMLPITVAPAVSASPDEGWSARKVGKSVIPARDRALTAKLPGHSKIGYHPETGRVRFLSGSPGNPLSAALPSVASGKRTLSAADTRTAARRFVERYGPLFGLQDPARELRVKDTQRHLTPATLGARVGAGRPNATVRFAQVRDGVPVMGGEIAVQLSAEGEVLSAAGEVLPTGSQARTDAEIGPISARNTAAAWVARETGRKASSVHTTSEGLGLYDPRLMDDPMLAELGTRLVWQIDVRLAAVGREPGDRRLVLVDARGGGVLSSISRVHSAEGPNRRVCDDRNTPGAPFACNSPARSEGQPATGVRDVDAAYRLMGVTYDYFYDHFGRDGIDGAGSRMKATVRYCPRYGCPWRNAEWKWAEQQAVFGSGWAKADDIVAHEFTHGVLDAEAPLFYQYQSGAINESYADVFGELIDLSYGGGTDTKSSKWKIGEDAPIGVFRDMRNPTRFGHPDRVRSPKWRTGAADDGGVHRNSGVGNKAASLMADGGSFRGYKVKAIGRVRTARVWYQALTTRLTPAANYIDLADALVAACTDLAGSDGMTLAHCKSVRDVTRATQMDRTPRSQAPKRAPLCSAGLSAVDILQDDLEDPGSGRWAPSRLTGSKKGWYYPQNPNNVAAWDGTWASSGKLNFYAPDYGSRMDSVMRLTVPLALPGGAYLRFGHGFSFDKDAKRRYDGGILQIQVDGGPWRGVGNLFTHGGYNGRIAKGSGNPLKGKRAWTGDSHGWAQARLDLSRFAGSQVRFRFRMASDRSVGARGWYIDDIRVYACARDDAAPTGSVSIEGGAETTADADVTLTFSWDDADTWVTRLRISGSPRLDGDGPQLLKGISMPIRDEVAWDLSDTTYGGSGKPGVRRVYAQVRDAAGNWSDVFSDTIELLKP